MSWTCVAHLEEPATGVEKLMRRDSADRALRRCEIFLAGYQVKVEDVERSRVNRGAFVDTLY